MLTQRLASFFRNAIRSRGSTYFHTGRVCLVETSRDRPFEALVSGTQSYHVVIDIERQRRAWTLLVSCDCPYGNSFDDLCKHIWATLLALDEGGALADAPRDVSVEPGDDDPNEPGEPAYELDPDEDAGFDDHEYGDDYYYDGDGQRERVIRRRTLPAGRVLPAPRRRAEHVPQWRAVLQQVDASRYDTYTRRRFEPETIDPLYVLEPPTNEFDSPFVLSLAYQPTTRSGEPGKIKTLSLAPSELSCIRGERDRQICTMLIGAGDEYGTSYYGGYTSGRAHCRVSPEVHATLLPLLVETGRLYVRPERARQPRPLAWDEGEPWDFELALQPDEAGTHYAMIGQLRRDGV